VLLVLLALLSVCCEEGCEVARGYDLRALVTGEHQQAALVAGHEEICLAGFREGQQEIVARMEEFQVRQPVDVLGELSNLIDQPTCLIEFDEIGDSRLLQRGTQLVKVLRVGQESELALLPGIIDCRGASSIAPCRTSRTAAENPTCGTLRIHGELSCSASTPRSEAFPVGWRERPEIRSSSLAAGLSQSLGSDR